MTLPNLLLTDKVAVVTGGRRGIGAAVALLFAEAGAHVAVSDVVADDELKEVTERIKGLGRKALAIKADTTKSDQVSDMIQSTVDELGGVDILVNAAGISTRTTPMEISEDEWDRVMDIDLKGCLLCSQAACKRMMEQGRGGVVINLTSVAGIKAVPFRAGYASAKIGLIMLTKQMALELAPHGIRVNAIAPGVVRTGLTEDMWSDPEAKKQMENMVPMRRWGEAGEIADAALFLASETASYITGVTLPVDGAISLS